MLVAFTPIKETFVLVFDVPWKKLAFVAILTFPLIVVVPFTSNVELGVIVLMPTRF